MKNRIQIDKEFLDNYIFRGLQNLNDGFDSSGIKYFSEDDFGEVLKRIKQYGLGVLGIEPWKNGAFYQVKVYEDFTEDATDSNWYMQAFQKFKEEKEGLLYAASYCIPGTLLKQCDL